MRLVVHEIVDRPPREVFRFLAADHVRNHPRWDPSMELEQLSEGPIGVGTVIRRRHTDYGAPIEGTMKVVEYQPDRAFGVVIHDGPLEIRSRMVIEPAGRARMRLTLSIDIPTATSPLDPALVEASLREMKRLMESDG